MRLSVGLPLALLLIFLQVLLLRELSTMAPPLLLLLAIQLMLTLSRDDIPAAAFLLGVLHDLTFGLHLGLGTSLFLLFAGITLFLRSAVPQRNLFFQMLYAGGVVFLFSLLEPLIFYGLDFFLWIPELFTSAGERALAGCLLYLPLSLLLFPLPLLLPDREEPIRFGLRG